MEKSELWVYKGNAHDESMEGGDNSTSGSELKKKKDVRCVPFDRRSTLIVTRIDSKLGESLKVQTLQMMEIRNKN